MINAIVKMFVGKNAPSLGRAFANYVAGLLLASVIFTAGSRIAEPSADTVSAGEVSAPVPGVQPAPGWTIDPALEDTFSEVRPSREELEDGLTIDELARAIFAILLAWVSRLNSWLRAKNKDWLANGLGWIIGRSKWSMIRFVLEWSAGVLTYFELNPAATPEAMSAMPLDNFVGALILFVSGRILSATEDAKRNPETGRLTASNFLKA